MTNEEWRDVIGYEGLYQVSSMGRIRSVDRTIIDRNGISRRLKGKVLRPELGNCGYLIIKLTKDGVKTSLVLHRLVAKAFLPDADWSLQVDHINGIRHDNRIENLRFVTPQENTDNKMRLGNRRNPAKYVPASYDEVTDLPGEEWRPVAGYEGLYEVSDAGRVKSLNRVVVGSNGIERRVHGKLLNGRLSPAGYRVVNLCGDKNADRLIHRLVAEAFLEPDSDPERNIVDHINAIRTDNRLENLRWVTQKENVQHAIDMGNLDLKKNVEASCKTNRKPVIRNDGVVYPSIVDAAKATGVHAVSVGQVLNGKIRQTKGYSFKFADDADGEFWSNGITDLDGEEWKPIKGYEDQYYVSNMGRVKSLAQWVTDKNGRTRFVPETLMSHERTGSKHLAVSLKKNGVTTEKDICQLVANAFIRDEGDDGYVEHINGDERDDRAENLRFAKNRRKTPHHRRPVVRDDGVVFKSISHAARALGVDVSAVGHVVRGKARTCCGFSFRYLYQYE